ncbi:MAG TPA: DUF1800 family protein [Xanthobacteraceae bacterium]
MTTDPKAEAATALHRFGFGPRAGSIAAIAADPRGALLAEIARPGAGRITDQDLLSNGEAARAAFDFRQERKAARLAERAERETARNAANIAAAAAAVAANPTNTPPTGMQANAGPCMPPGPMQNAASPLNAAPLNAAPQNAAQPKPNPGPGIPQQIFLEEAQARINAALGAEIGFAERLAWFWSNHFCVSMDKGQIRALAGAYEREAIRPHVLGRFADMLQAVESHPAMLIYLDNQGSVGPNSIAGINRHKGINENLAREIMELHTLGVRTVYSQADVTRFADVITGWTIVPPRQDPVHGGEFTFNPRMHQPGDQSVIGKSFPDTGIEQGRAVLAMLARHPATAHHVAQKLVRHFISAQPVPPLADKLARRFTETDGDLKEVAKVLVTAPESWAGPRQKFKRPGEWIVSALRATGVTPPDIRPVVQAQEMLGEPLWRPPAPHGFVDDDAAWLDGLAGRLDIANQLARRVAGMVEPEAAMDAALGPLASPEIRQAVARAESRPQALALLFMAPEFQRR